MSSAATAAATVAAKKSSVHMEDIELGIINNNVIGNTTKVNSTRINDDSVAEVPWFKYPLYFTISYQSYLIKTLTVISILFNIILNITIPYEV